MLQSTVLSTHSRDASLAAEASYTARLGDCIFFFKILSDTNLSLLDIKFVMSDVLLVRYKALIALPFEDPQVFINFID